VDTTTLIESYAELGVIGVCMLLFGFMITNLIKSNAMQQEALENLKIENKGQSETLENLESITLKLITRWGTSDDKLDRKFDALTKEINDLDNQVSELKGSMSRINGRH
tara:strand:+ start:1786 stop:2112 length:327 start_codon:yes stop_codon:yes gene_type:complete